MPHTYTYTSLSPVEVSESIGYLPFEYGGFGYGIGPYANGNRPWFNATGTVADRHAGRQLPLFWSEIDLRGFRLIARDLDSRNQFAIGFLNLLVGYHVHKGYGWQACKRGAKKTPYPTVREADPLIDRAQQILDAWRDGVKWGIVSREAFRRWRRDGEVFGRFFRGGWDRLPKFRFVDPERVGSPTGDTDGETSFGIRTDADDVCDIIAYHVWDADGMTGKWIDADKIVYAKTNTDTGVKRGVTDFLPVAEDLDWCRRILRSMLTSTNRQASKAWIEKLPGATAEQVRGIVPVVPGRTTVPYASTNPYDPFNGYRGYGYDPNIMEPAGSIMRTEGDREFIPVPGGTAVGGYIQAVQSGLRGGCVRWNLPEFASADASNNNYASALIANSPFTRTVEGVQYEWADSWERPCALKVLELAAEVGLLSESDLRQLDVEVTPPQVASADPDKDTSRRNTMHAAGVLSATTWQLQEGLDPQHEQANFESEQQSGMQPGPEPTDDQTPPDGGELGQLTAKLGEDKRSGLVKKTITDKDGVARTVYVRPDEPKKAQPKAKAKDQPDSNTHPHGDNDPDKNRPSRPENRHEGNRPATKEWRDPPAPQGQKGAGKVTRPKGNQSQTKLGDLAEAKTADLGFRNILPEGRRSNKDVKTEGSSIDVEFDHSGRAYEVKMCKTTATEYRAKPKPEEIEGKIKFAEMHDLEPYTMIAVLDQDSGEIHYYASKQPGITTKKLSPEHFDYVGTVTL